MNQTLRLALETKKRVESSFMCRAANEKSLCCSLHISRGKINVLKLLFSAWSIVEHIQNNGFGRLGEGRPLNHTSVLCPLGNLPEWMEMSTRQKASIDQRCCASASRTRSLFVWPSIYVFRNLFVLICLLLCDNEILFEQFLIKNF